MKRIILRSLYRVIFIMAGVSIVSIFLDVGVVITLERIFFVSFVVCWLIFFGIMLPYGLYRKYRQKQTDFSNYAKTIIIIISFYFVTGFQGLVLGAIANYKARNEIKSIMDQMKIDNVRIILDGKPLKDERKIILFRGLQKIQWVSNKGGYCRRQCEIYDDKTKLLLVISKNAEGGSTSLLVFYPKYYGMKFNPIGGFYLPRKFSLFNPYFVAD